MPTAGIVWQGFFQNLFAFFFFPFSHFPRHPSSCWRTLQDPSCQLGPQLCKCPFCSQQSAWGRGPRRAALPAVPAGRRARPCPCSTEGCWCHGTAQGRQAKMSERYGEVSLFHQASNGSVLMWTPCCKDGAAHFLPALSAIPLDYKGEALYAMEQLHTCTDSAAHLFPYFYSKRLTWMYNFQPKNSWWTLPHFVLMKCHEQLVVFLKVWIIKTKWPTWLKVGICTNVWLHQGTYEYCLLNKPGSAPMDRNQTTHISKPWPVRPCVTSQAWGGPAHQPWELVEARRNSDLWSLEPPPHGLAHMGLQVEQGCGSVPATSTRAQGWWEQSWRSINVARAEGMRPCWPVNCEYSYDCLSWKA